MFLSLVYWNNERDHTDIGNMTPSMSKYAMTEDEMCPYLSTGQSATEARILFKHTTQTALPTNG